MKAYVHKDGQQYGPFTVEQLRQYVRQGNFTTGDHACHDGQNWVTIAQVPGFAEATQPAASPSPTTTRRNQVVRKKAVARQPAPANAVDSQPNKKKIILWSSIGGGATLLVAGLLIWLLGNEDDLAEDQTEIAPQEAKPDATDSRLAHWQPQEEVVETPEAPEANEAHQVVVNFYQLQYRDGIACFEGKPFSGIVVKKSSTGMDVKTIFKDGKLIDWVPLSAALLDQEVAVPPEGDGQARTGQAQFEAAANAKAAAEMEAAIREGLKKPTGELTEADLEKVTELDLGNGEITNASVLSSSGLIKLKQLTLVGNNLVNVDALAEFTELREVYLGWNQLTDISGLAGPTQLEVLFLDHNRITDLAPLAGLTHLKKLYLDNNQITDVSPLKGLKKLDYLSLGSNKIADDQKAMLRKALPNCKISF